MFSTFVADALTVGLVVGFLFLAIGLVLDGHR